MAIIFDDPITQITSQIDSKLAGINNSIKGFQDKTGVEDQQFKDFTAVMKAKKASQQTDLANIMRNAIVNSPELQSITSHPDFPALAGDNGIQSLVGALTNQVGKVMAGIKGGGQNPITTLGD